MNSNLDVWAIQYYPEQLFTALNQLKNGINIIYSNCTCEIKLASQNISTRQFDTFLYNEDSDILIMLMRGGKASKEQIIKYLEDNGKQYTEITFAPSVIDYKDGDNIPELWFSREKYVLEDALKDSLNNGINSCVFYPNVLGELNMGYIYDNTKKSKIDVRIFKGLVKLDDKLVLIINQSDNFDRENITRNMSADEIIELLKDYGFNFDISNEVEPEIIIESFSRKLK